MSFIILGNSQTWAATNYDIILIAGQSNAVGIGLGPTNEDPSLKFDSHIDQLGRFGSDNMRTIPATSPLQHWGCYQGPCGEGFALSFARRYAQTLLPQGRKILLIPAALGGSGSYQWDLEIESSPNPKFQDSTVLLTDLRERLRFALTLPGQNRVVALLWHQGETDAICLSQGAWCNQLTGSPQAFANRIAKIFSILRQDANTNFPILLGQFVPAWTKGWRHFSLRRRRNQIENALQNIASRSFPAAVVSSSGLTANSEVIPGSRDSIHFSAQAQIEFGRRYFAAFEKLQIPISN